MSGTMGWLDCWKMCVSCSPAALRKTPPAPPVTLLRYPAVNRFKLQQPPPLPPPQPPPPPSPPALRCLRQKVPRSNGSDIWFVLLCLLTLVCHNSTLNREVYKFRCVSE